MSAEPPRAHPALDPKPKAVGFKPGAEGLDGTADAWGVGSARGRVWGVGGQGLRLGVLSKPLEGDWQRLLQQGLHCHCWGWPRYILASCIVSILSGHPSLGLYLFNRALVAWHQPQRIQGRAPLKGQLCYLDIRFTLNHPWEVDPVDLAATATTPAALLEWQMMQLAPCPCCAGCNIIISAGPIRAARRQRNRCMHHTCQLTNTLA